MTEVATPVELTVDQEEGEEAVSVTHQEPGKEGEEQQQQQQEEEEEKAVGEEQAEAGTSAARKEEGSTSLAAASANAVSFTDFASGAVFAEEEEETAEFSFRTASASVALTPQRRKHKHAVDDPEAASVMSRSAAFVPFNPWTQPPEQLAALDAEQDEPLELTEEHQSKHNKLISFQTDNNAILKHYDVLGFNFKRAKYGGQIVVAHADDDSVIYSAGKHLTCVGINSVDRRMLLRAENCVGVNTFTVSSDGKYIAVSERRIDAPYVTIYKIDSNARVASLNFKFLSKQQVAHVAFSSNNRLLLTVTSIPESKMFLWNLEDVKVAVSTDVPHLTTHISVNPWDSTRMVTMGPDHFLLWAHKEKVLNSFDPIKNHKWPMFPNQSPQFVAHTWYDEECVAVLTASGRLIAIESHAVVYDSMIKTNERNVVFNQLVWASRGLVAAGTQGFVVLLDRTYSEPTFSQVVIFSTLCRHSEIVSLSISPAEQNIVVAMANNTMEFMELEDLNSALQARLEAIADEEEKNLSEQERINLAEQRNKVIGTAGFSLDASNILRTSALDASRSLLLSSADRPQPPTPRVELELSDALFRPMRQASFHSAMVTSVSIALQRPVIFTTSLDGTIRAYDFMAHKALASKELQDEVLGGGIHPIGIHVVALFKYSARVFAIVSDDFMHMADIAVKGATGMAISKGGGLIAFSVINRIHLYNGHSYRYIGQLIGHSALVKSISFACNDTKIVTADAIGVIICWDPANLKRDGMESSQKNLIFQNAIYHPQTGLFAAVGSNKHARAKIFEGEFTIVCCTPGADGGLVYCRPGMVLPKNQAIRKTHCKLLAIAELSKTLFVGTTTGRILLYSWPLLRTSKPYSYFDSHNSEVVQLLLSPDEKFLFTVSSDHTMYVYKVEQMHDGKFIAATEFNFDLFSGVRFVEAAEAEDKQRDIHFLKRSIEDKRAEIEAHVSFIRKVKEEEQKELLSKADISLDALRKEIDKINTVKDRVEDQSAKEIASVEAQHIHTAEEIENLYNRRIEDALKQYEVLNDEREELVVKYESVLSKAIAEGQRASQKLEAQCKERQKGLVGELEQLREQIREQRQVHDAMLAQTVVDFETRATQLKEQHEGKVRQKEEKVFKAATSATSGDRETEKLKKELAILRLHLNKRSETVKELNTTIERRAKENKQLKAEMLAKQEQINVAERKMQQLKQQLTVLENLRFVLTHQFEQLQSEVVPKDGEIRKLEMAVVDKEEDLQALNMDRNSILERVVALNEKLDTLNADNNELRVSMLDQERKSKIFFDELGRLLDTYKDPKTFYPSFKKVVEEAQRTFKYKVEPPSEEVLRTQSELENHKKYLDAKGDHMQMMARQHWSMMTQENRTVLAENSRLVAEIKGLRQERKALHQMCWGAEMQLRDVRMALHRMTSTRMIQQQPTPAITASPTPTSSRPITPPRRKKARPLLPPLKGLTTKKKGQQGEAKEQVGLSGVVVGPSPSLLGNTTRASSAKKSEGEAVDPSSQLHTMLATLDGNTERMHEQQHEIIQLRTMVQSLLREEERRLTSKLNAFSPEPNATPGPYMDTSSAADTPDWNVSNMSAGASAARPMSPLKGLDSGAMSRPQGDE